MSSRFAHLKMKKYAATAQAEYKHTYPRTGTWTGSIGLASTTIDAPSQKFAEQKARAFYKQEWLAERTLGDELVKLHICVVEL